MSAMSMNIKLYVYTGGVILAGYVASFLFHKTLGHTDHLTDLVLDVRMSFFSESAIVLSIILVVEDIGVQGPKLGVRCALLRLGLNMVSD